MADMIALIEREKHTIRGSGDTKMVDTKMIATNINNMNLIVTLAT